MKPASNSIEVEHGTSGRSRGWPCRLGQPGGRDCWGLAAANADKWI